MENKKTIAPVDVKYIGVPNVCFSQTEKDDKREIEFLKQRLERGFDDSETWSLSDTVGLFTLPRLKRFKEVTDGFRPSTISKKNGILSWIK